MTEPVRWGILGTGGIAHAFATALMETPGATLAAVGSRSVGSAAGAPPTFIAAGSNDKCCASLAIALHQQLKQAGVSAELQLYADTDHAFNMGTRSDRISVQHWPARWHEWLLDGGWLAPGQKY